MSRPLVVSEVFGPTVQGEGPSTGRVCGFLRLGGCNLSCRWCDTAYTWDWTGISDMATEQGRPFRSADELHPMDVVDAAALAVKHLPAADHPLLVVSGGEPLTQQDTLAATLGLIRDLCPGVEVEVETNGTRAPTPHLASHVDRFNVSPKLSHSGDPVERRIVPSALASLQATGKAIWKFVAATTHDLDAVATLTEQYALPADRVWIMPLGRTPPDVRGRLATLADAVVERGWNLTTRLHVQAWGDRRGV